ncbi:MAG TPA: enoyl-CoA hydratase, partial [Brevundimonas sp.]|nr:enoyl-CoA hydratase [Brevundimonas sp.]
MTGLIETRRDGPIVIWTLNRPERLNALPDLEDGEAFATACETVN